MADDGCDGKYRNPWSPEYSGSSDVEDIEKAHFRIAELLDDDMVLRQVCRYR